MARHLLDAGAAPVLVCAKEPDAYRGAALHWLRVAMSLGVPVVPADAWAKGDARAPSAPDIVVDALLGTGFHGKLRERETSFVEKLNALSAPFVLAVDVPSGLSARNGRPSPTAVRAHVTVTFQAAKPGLLLPKRRITPALSSCGP